MTSSARGTGGSSPGRGSTRMAGAAAAATGVVGAVALLVGALLPQPWLAALGVILLAVAASLTGLALHLRGVRMLSTRINRLARQVTKDRQDASRWEWRIANSLGVHASGSDAPAATPRVGAGERERHPRLNLLLASKVFDPAFYGAMVGSRFDTVDDAATDFLTAGMKRKIPPHPLLDLRHLPQSVAAAYQAGNLDILLRYLRGARSGVGVLGDFFDARLLETTGTTTQGHPGGVLGWFVDNAADDTFLPTAGAALRWGAAKRALGEAVVAAGQSAYWGRPRTTTDFDEDAAAAWWADVVGLELPEPVAGHPLFSIVMPAWNRATRIGAAIASVQRQGVGDWELLVVDDGSTDDTVSVVRAIAAEDPRVRLVPQDHAGVSAARNLGIREARGTYLAFLDTDNEWTDGYLERMAKGLLGSESRAGYAALELHQGGIVRYRAFTGGLDELLVLNHIDLNIFVVEARLAREVGGFDEGLRRWVDHDFAIKVARRAEPILFPFVGCIYDDEDADDGQRITTSQSEHWQWKVLGNNWVDFDAAVSRAAARVPGRTSVVIPTWNDHEMTLAAVDAVLASSADHDVEILVVDNGSGFPTSHKLAIALTGRRSTTYLRLPRNLNFGIGSNHGAVHSSGEYVLFVNNDTEAQPGWLDGLLDRLADPQVIGVQPLLLYPDDSIQAAGIAFLARNTLPVNFLAGHPPEDAGGLADDRFRAATAAALLLRAEDFLEVRGFDPIFVNGLEDVDLCLRLGAARPGGHFAVAPSSRVYHKESRTPGRGAAIPENRRLFFERWRGQLEDTSDLSKLHVRGFALARVGSDGLVPPAPRPVIMRERDGAPLRWGVRYAAVGGPKGDRWGDTHYVSSLAAGLRSLGHEVVTYRHGANTETGCLLDDVNLVIRGLDAVPPVPGAVNILWILSHPGDVTARELASYDLVYAASSSWAERATRRHGIPIVPLLQATDTERFFPRDTDATRPVTFVGSVHPGRRRGIVEDALMANIDFRVIGTGWDLPRTIHEADFVENHLLPDIYRSSRRVLADHWGEMAREGFIQNRIFDAVACGSRVITDPVVGLTEVFGSAVQTYSTIDELRRLCSDAAAYRFGTPESLRGQADLVVREHSFAARAEFLTRAVRELVPPRA